jgi:hypothetical protein
MYVLIYLKHVCTYHFEVVLRTEEKATTTCVDNASVAVLHLLAFYGGRHGSSQVSTVDVNDGDLGRLEPERKAKTT